jgi:3-oxoadipate enol-lactonase
MSCLALDWGHLHVRVRGAVEAPAVLFINSLGTDLRMWEGVAERMPGVRAIGFDARGHGLSATPATDWTIEDLAGDAIAVLDALGIARVVVAGCSVGGMVAQHLAAVHPGRVIAAVFSNTAARIGTAESWQARIAAVEAHGMGAIAEAVLERWFAAPFRQGAAHLLWRTMLERCDPAGYAGTCRALARADLGDRIAAIRCPALVLAGAEDQATPAALVRDLADALADARFHLIAGSGHLPAIDNPAGTAALMLDFLGGYVHV